MKIDCKKLFRLQQVIPGTAGKRLWESGLCGQTTAKKLLLRLTEKKNCGSIKNLDFGFLVSGEQMVPSCVAPTAEHGGGAIVFGGFAGDTVGDLFRK